MFRDVSFALAAGSLLHVAGANGSGKTTLLRILTGLGVADAGEVRWHGELLRAQRESYARELVYVGHAAALKDDLSAEENLHLAGVLAGHAITAVAACDALTLFGLGECLRLPARLMSQGQRRRAVLARLALAHDAPLWILDEPFNALDVAAVALLEGLLIKHVEGGGIVSSPRTRMPQSPHARPHGYNLTPQRCTHDVRTASGHLPRSHASVAAPHRCIHHIDIFCGGGQPVPIGHRR